MRPTSNQTDTKSDNGMFHEHFPWVLQTKNDKKTLLDGWHLYHANYSNGKNRSFSKPQQRRLNQTGNHPGHLKILELILLDSVVKPAN